MGILSISTTTRTRKDGAHGGGIHGETGARKGRSRRKVAGGEGEGREGERDEEKKLVAGLVSVLFMCISTMGFHMERILWRGSHS